MIALVKLLPESPLYHLMKKNEINAKNSLKRFRGEDYEDDVEMEELKYLAVASRSKEVRSVLFVCFMKCNCTDTS